MIKDGSGRTFRTLRVSLTSSCNMACVYCVGEKPGIARGKKEEYKGLEQYIKSIAMIHSLTPLKTVRLTGGEPFLFRDLIPLVEAIKALGIPEVKLTTNGVFLGPKAAELKAAGVSSINVSLDAVSPEKFHFLTKTRNLDRVLYGIEQALGAGIEVKINSVIMKGRNEDQVLPLLKYASERNVIIRFLELMKMGPLRNDHEKLFFSQEEILDIIGKESSVVKLIRRQSSTANYWMTEEGSVFGIIANESEPFCMDCDRLRLDSNGNIYGCLSTNVPVPFQDVTDSREDAAARLRVALSQKQKEKFTGSEMVMKSIGG